MNEFVTNCFDVLGYRAKDKITGFEGICSSISFDLYGCIQICLTGPVKDGKVQLFGYDIHRLDIFKSSPRVMDIPDFAAMAYKVDPETKIKESSSKPNDFGHGPAEKPAGFMR